MLQVLEHLIKVSHTPPYAHNREKLKDNRIIKFRADSVYMPGHSSWLSVSLERSFQKQALGFFQPSM